MPPKRKASNAASKGPAAKKSKTPSNSAARAKTAKGKKASADSASDIETIEQSAEPVSAAKQLAETLKKAANDKKKFAKVDPFCVRLSSGTVLGDYDCMLNQTNIGHNNNKFYVIQVIEFAGNYYCWNRWGRVGEPGANALKGPFTDKQKAIDDFKKKFTDKTKNKWESRQNFTAHPGKYTLLEMGDEDEVDTAIPSKPDATAINKDTLPCTLDKPTQDLIKLIFDNDMFQEALQRMEIDTKKMPLGKISKAQIAKGFEALEEIEEAIKNNKKSKLEELSSKFYTLIPHNFGRSRPPTISTTETLQAKMDMLAVIADIELAQAMQKETEPAKEQTSEKEPHPLDQKYEKLQCKLKLVEKKSKTFEVIKKYTDATKGSWLKVNLLDVWEVDRSSEGKRFDANKDITNRKLLWHGTNVAVVAAILKSGLRIMPHSGGRVGRGIYFASENSKSAGYVRPAGKIGIMFLNEVALGKEHHITVDNSSLKAAPKGYDSIVAKGRTEPDPAKDTTIVLDGNKVVVPQGPAIDQPQFLNSSFSQSEYLIYREDQCRIRYLLKIQFG